MAPFRSSALAACWAALAAATDVYVMLPLDTVTSAGTLKDEKGLGAQLDKLKEANVDGFMADVWWGITERNPKAYDFNSTKELVRMGRDRGMSVQLVASFHECGGNVGDACDIPLPGFLQTNKDMGSTIKQVQVGLGPAGELRYPSYQLSQWKFCGIGAFQCWDAHALASFTAAAKAAGRGYDSPPKDAGSYNDRPHSSSFWQGGYSSEYGKFFLDWYFSSLKSHGKAVLAAASKAFKGKVAIAAKISGIHWWYKDPTHPAEMTAGYYNMNGRDAYAELTKEVFAPNAASVDFTCIEMKDSEQDASCGSGPQELVQQVLSSAKAAGLPFAGENALPRYDTTAYGQIESYRSSMASFTYLRLGNDLLQGSNFGSFKDFVNRMRNGQTVIQV